MRSLLSFSVVFFCGSPYLLGGNTWEEASYNRAVLSAEHDDVRVTYQIKRVSRWQVGEVLVAHRVSAPFSCVNTP